jgi:hypothetical protein
MVPAAISDFFSKSFTENFTKLLQPANLIGSSIFIVLNLLFIFPGLANKHVQFVIDLMNLNSALQIVLTVIAILLIAYLLLSFQSFILKLLTGEEWPHSVILGDLLIKRQRAVRQRIMYKMDKLQCRFDVYRLLKLLSQGKLLNKNVLDQAEKLLQAQKVILDSNREAFRQGDISSTEAVNNATDQLQSQLNDLIKALKDPYYSTPEEYNYANRLGLISDLGGKFSRGDLSSQDKLIQAQQDVLNDLRRKMERRDPISWEWLSQQERNMIRERGRIGWKLYTRFSLEEEYIAPTAMGNALNVTSSNLWSRYQIEMTAFWPHMQIIVASDGEQALGKRINDEKTTLDFLVSLTFILSLFTVELILCQFFVFNQRIELAWALIPLALALIVYHAAVNQANTWGTSVQLAFDTRRDALRKILSLRSFASEEDERDVWRRVGAWLLYGERCDDVFVIQQMIEEKNDTQSK